MKFPTTHWTLVRAARASESARREALGVLFSGYWKPVYFYLRRRGLDEEKAKDTVQAFFTDLLERGFPSRADPARGRLRSYLKAALDNYLVNQHARETAAKRGGGTVAVPIDTEWAERHLASAAENPERAYEREWAAGLIARALDRLRGEYFQASRRARGEAVLRYFEPGPPLSYADAAAEAGMSVAAFKAALHRARTRFRELLREEVAQTTQTEGAVEDEMAHLLSALRR